MRPVDIQAVFLKAAVEEIDHESQRDLTQPEIFRREDR